MSFLENPLHRIHPWWSAGGEVHQHQWTGPAWGRQVSSALLFFISQLLDLTLSSCEVNLNMFLFLSRFHVNLQCGSRPNTDIALHFNPRYDSQPGYVVTNSFQNGSWGTEERKHNSPFPAGSTFSLLITITRESYQVSDI